MFANRRLLHDNHPTLRAWPMTIGKLRSVKYTIEAVIATARYRPYVPPGHFYSPITSREDIERVVRTVKATVDGIDLQEDQQFALAEKLAPMWKETVVLDGRYRPDNMYVLSDAAIYSSVLRHCTPSQVVEVGSGFSSALALDTSDRHGLAVAFTFIEPYPQRLERLLKASDRVKLYRTRVQDVPLDVFDQLGAGDILFIDSTHVVKPGSDVIHLVMTVLPRLRPGVLVHFHDVFWPFEYPESWLRQHRDWTEDYLLHAFLAYNSDFEILLFNDWLWQSAPELIERWLPSAVSQRPGGLWLKRRE